ncbi:hypothetical protein ACHAXA_004925, partial [Cyclostephanos tholiformis]
STKRGEAVKIIIHYGKRRKEASRRSVCGHLGSKTKKTDDPAPPPARRTLHHFEKNIAVKMHLMYYLDENGKRVYTLKKSNPEGKVTESAHPARFSPDDKFSRQRVAIKKRFGIYLPDSQLSKPL